MKAKLILLYLGFMPYLFGQNEKILGVEYFATEQQKIPWHQVIGNQDDISYAIRAKRAFTGTGFKFKLFLHKLDENGFPSKTVKMKILPKFYLIHANSHDLNFDKGLIFYNSKIFHFYAAADKTQKDRISVYVAEYSLNNLSYLETRTLKTTAIPTNGGINFELFHDANNKNTLFLAIQSPLSQDTDELEIIQFDEHLNSIFRISSQHKKELNLTFDDFHFDGYWITYREKLKVNKKDKPKYAVHAVNTKTNERHTLKGNLENKLATVVNLGIRKNKDDSFIVYGVYALDKSKKSDNATVGFFSQKIDFKNVTNLKNEDQQELDLSFVDGEGLRTTKHVQNLNTRLKFGAEVFDFEIKGVVRHIDESFTIIAESQQDYSVVNQNLPSASGHQTQHERNVQYERDIYVNMDIFFIKISKDGKVTGIKRYERFNSTTDPLNEIKTIVTSQFIYVLHFDNGDFYVVQYDPENAEIKRDYLNNWGETDKYSVPQLYNAKEIKKNTIQLPVIRLFKWKMLTMIFPE